MTLLALSSSSPASIDALRSERATFLTQALGVAGFALLTVVGAQIRIPLWEVPITLQTLAVYGAGLFLGARNGLFSQVLYLALGLALPVFSGSEFGATHLFGVTGGYLLAMPLAAFVAGALTRKWNTFMGSLLALVASSALLFGIGVTWLHFAAGHDSWQLSIARGWLPFVVLDLAKVGLAALVYSSARRIS